MSQLRRFAYFVLLGLTILVEGWSQSGPPDLYFNHYFEKFSITNISSIVQDTSGFIWIGTLAGLNRFDGQEFITFESSRSDPHSLTDNRINDLMVDQNGRLWIATYQDLMWFDDALNSFIPVDRRDNPFLETDAMTLEQDQQGNIWVGTLHGLYRTDASFQNLERFDSEVSDLNDASINDLLYDSRDQLWVGTSGQLVRMDGERQDVVLRDVDITSIEEHRHQLWAGTRSKGLFQLSDEGEVLAHYLLDAASEEGNSNRIFDILSDSQGHLWVGTEIGGMHWYHPDSDRFYAYTKGLDEGSLKSNSIWEIFEDQSGRLWLGTNNQGVFVRDRNFSKFGQVTPTRGQIQQLKFGTVSAFLPVENGLWIGTDGGGVSVYDSLKRHFSFFDKSRGGGGLGSDEVLTIFRDSEGLIWTGNWGGGLNRYDPVTRSFETFLNDPNDPKSLGSNNVFAIREDQHGDLWCTTWGKGLSKLDKKSGSFSHIGFVRNDPNQLSSDLTYDLEIDEKGHLWVATVLGLDKITVLEDTFKVEHYRYDADDSTSLSSLNVNCILIDSQKRIWAGTKYGLNIMEPDGQGFQRIFKEDGLSDNDIKSVTEDDFGNYWVATGKGLTRMQKVDGQWDYHVYDESDGILSREFFNNASLKATSGRVFLGGLNGFNHFDPTMVKLDTITPKVQFTDLRIFNKVVTPGGEGPLSRHLNLTSKITLNHQQSVFTLDYLAIHYTHADKNQFAYQLEGLETQWNYVGSLRQATYTNLDPGTYVFRVKAANHDSIWGKERRLLIEILPPWWETFWFRFLASLGLISVLLTIYLIRVNFLKVQRTKLQKEVARQTHELKSTNKELHRLGKFKEVITGMLVHDLKNPLHLILGLSDQKTDKDLKEINQSGRRMLYMVSNLLDIQKFEETTMKLDEKEFDLRTMVNEARRQFELVFRAKSLLFVSNVEPVNVRGDFELLLRVMQNLLSNAVKYTEFEGSITVSSREAGSRVIVEVADTGVGIAEEEQERIFDKFHQVNPKKLGATSSTGLGLTFCKMAVVAHGGEIKVNSEPGKGSTFYFDIARSDNQEILNDAFSGTISRDFLSQEELQAIRLIAPELASLRLYEVSKIESLVNRIQDTEQILQWKSALKEAAYHWDEERYRELTEL